jgi:dihydrofolate reductase
LVDECLLLLVPAIVGGGKPAFADGLRVDLDLTEQRRFDNGTLFLRYAVRG